jgi:Ca2+-binding EF-hand superfamily protein
MADENQSSELSEIQVAELRKAFAICDQDGNGVIDASELRTVIRAILDEDPSDEEFQQIMLTVDADRNGQIEWSEFLAAMTEWLQEDYKNRLGSNKRRKLNPEQERQEFHQKIKGFFSQFKKGADFDAIRNKLQRSGVSYGRLADFEQEPKSPSSRDAMNVVGMEAGLSSQSKLDFLLEYRQHMMRIDHIVNAIRGGHRSDQLEATTLLAKLLSITQVFATPMERRAVAEDIVAIFEVVVKSNLVSHLIRLLQEGADHPLLQFQALRALSFFLPGPRVASTPKESVLHPSKMFFKKLVIAEGAVPIFIKLLESAIIEVKEQAAHVLGVLAATNPECRDFVLQNGAMAPLCSLVTLQTPINLLRKISWTLSVLCGVTHPADKLPPWELIHGSLNQLATMLFIDDEEALVSTLSAMALVLPGMPEATVCKRLVDLLANPSPRVVRFCLAAINDISRFDANQTMLLLKNNLLEALKKMLMHKESTVRIAACEVICTLANARGHIQFLINCGILEMILKLISVDENARWKLVKVLKYCTRGTPSQIKYLVSKETIQHLCKALIHFKAYDRVLTEVYKYCGPTYNFDFVVDILSALENIINIGEMEGEETQSANKYALEFDLECIDKIKSLLAAMKESKPEDLNAWRGQLKPGDTPVEHKVKSILYKVKIALDRAGQKTAKNHLSTMIMDIWKQYFATSGPQPQNKILLKCFLGDDIRVIEVPRDIQFNDLQNGLQTKYAKQMNITYKDEEGDHITIDSQPILQKVLAAADKAKHRTVKLYLIEKSDATHRDLGISASPGSPFGSPLGTRKLDSYQPTSAPDSPALKPLTPLPGITGSGDQLMFQMDDVGKAGGLQVGAKRTRHGDKKETDGNTNNNNLFSPLAAIDLTNAAKLFAGDVEDIKRETRKSLLEDMESLTHFGKEELQQLFDDWQKQADSQGRVGRSEFERGIRALGITDPLLIEQNFSAFDVDKDGAINFKEFVVGLSTVLRGTPEERMQFMFRSYDTDGSGFLTFDEIYNIFQASFQSKGEKVEPQELLKMVKQCFEQIDTNGDGKLSFDEFKAGVESQKLFINLFVHYPSSTSAK